MESWMAKVQRWMPCQRRHLQDHDLSCMNARSLHQGKILPLLRRRYPINFPWIQSCSFCDSMADGMSFLQQAILVGRWQSLKRHSQDHPITLSALWRWRGLGGQKRSSPLCWTYSNHTYMGDSCRAMQPRRKGFCFKYMKRFYPWIDWPQSIVRMFAHKRQQESWSLSHSLVH